MIGFCLHRGDVAPALYRGFERRERVRSFVVQFNALMGREFAILPSAARDCDTVRDVFMRQISKMLRVRGIYKQKCDTICIESNIYIQKFLRGDFSQTELAGTPQMRAAKLIAFICNNAGVQFDEQFLFENYVFDKICAANRDREIYRQNGCIYIQREHGKRLGVVVCCEKFDAKCPDRERIERAFALSDENTDIYLVYPRQNGLLRHIAVRDEARNAEIKVVPYTINNFIRRRKP